MERDAARLPHARVWLYGLCEDAGSKGNQVARQGRQIFVSHILRRHEGGLTFLIGNKENHYKSGCGVFRGQNTFGGLSKWEH